eukprot:11206316-Lingulodinium_polyedra.AAC.1
MHIGQTRALAPSNQNRHGHAKQRVGVGADAGHGAKERAGTCKHADVQNAYVLMQHAHEARTRAG